MPTVVVLGVLWANGGLLVFRDKAAGTAANRSKQSTYQDAFQSVWQNSLPRKPESSTRKQIPLPSCSYLSVSSGEAG